MTAPIGALRARVRLERPALAPDGGGVAWDEIDDVWAAIVFPDIDARFQFEVRMRRDVRPGWRVALGDRRFRILLARDGDNRGARLLLECEEETP